MKKKRAGTLPSELHAAIRQFPKIVERKAKSAEVRRRFVEKTFGKLARKIDRAARKESDPKEEI